MKPLKFLSFILSCACLVRKAIFCSVIKSFLSLTLLLSSPSWSNPNFNEKLDNEFESARHIFTSEMIGKGLVLPKFNNKLPFWLQIGNSEQLPDIEGFYERSDPIIRDQIKENFFYLQLNSMRDIELLQAYFIDKFSKNHRTFTSDNNLDFFQLFNEHINEKDLNSIKDFMEKYSFSKTDKILTAIVLIHKQRFNDQILDFIKDLSLDINQTVRNKGFIYKHFHFLKPDIVITSLAYEFIATGNPSLIKKVGGNKDFNPNIRPPLGENLIPFFIRSNGMNQQSNQVSTPSIAISLLINQFSYFLNERDLMGFTPLMTAVQWNDRIAIDEIISFISSGVSPFELEDILKDRDYYGRDLIDIAFYNDNLKLASHLMEIAKLLSIDMTSHLYTRRPDNKQLIATNKLPFIHISPVFLSYIEDIQQIILEKNTDYEEGPIDQKEMEETNILLNDLKKESAQIAVWEQERQILISQLLKERSGIAVISAIQKKSKQALTELSELEKELLGVLISIEEGQPVFHEKESLKQNQMLIPQSREGVHQGNNITILTHFLNEAIIYSSLPAVQYILKNWFDEEWFKLFVESDQTKVNFVIDPLSLALFVYASIPDEKKQLKKEAKKIIRILSKYQNPEIYPNARIYSSPMGWAISLGLLDEVKFFHEKRLADIPESFVIGADDVFVEVKALLPTEIHNFLSLKKYMLKNQHDISESQEVSTSHCEQLFIN